MPQNNIKEQLGRYALFLIGLFVASLGVAFSTKAGLGTSPVASVPYSISIVTSIMSFGWWLNLWSVLQIIIQIVLLRRSCKPLEIVIQTVLAFVYGYLTDFSCGLLSAISPSNYPEQVFWMLVGCVVLAMGIWIQYKGGVAMLPGEAMNRILSFLLQYVCYSQENCRACGKEVLLQPCLSGISSVFSTICLTVSSAKRHNPGFPLMRDRIDRLPIRRYPVLGGNVRPQPEGEGKWIIVKRQENCLNPDITAHRLSSVLFAT